MKKTIVALFLLSVLISSCYYDNVEELYPNAGACETENLGFQSHIFPLIQSNCAMAGCHSANASIGAFVNYEGIKAKVDNGSMEHRVLVKKDMPPSQPLNECQRAQIKVWLDAGAPNN
jgi:hypothetical protein